MVHADLTDLCCNYVADAVQTVIRLEFKFSCLISDKFRTHSKNQRFSGFFAVSCSSLAEHFLSKICPKYYLHAHWLKTKAFERQYKLRGHRKRVDLSLAALAVDKWI